MRIEQKQLLDRILGWWLLLPLRALAQLIGAVARRDHGVEPRGEIVVLKILGGGSLLIALPLLLGIRRRYPRLPLTLVCGRKVAPFGDAVAVFDRIQVVEDESGLGVLLGSASRVLLSLVRRRVDTIIDLEVYSVLSTVFSLMTCARNRVGFYLESTYWRRNVHTHLVFFNRRRGVFHFYGVVGRLLGAAPASAEECRRHLSVDGRREPGPGEAARIRRVVDGPPMAAVGAGCSDLGRVRLLPPGEWKAFAATRRERLSRLRWVFLGSAEDRAVSEAVARAVADVLGSDAPPHENLCGELSLPGSLAVLREARLFLGVDSALLHAARLLGVPAVSFWGPTDPQSLLLPVDGLEEEIHYRPPLCSPCLHVAATPPCKGDNVCMRLFSSEEVPDTPWCEDASGRTVAPGGG